MYIDFGIEFVYAIICVFIAFTIGVLLSSIIAIFCFKSKETQ